MRTITLPLGMNATDRLCGDCRGVMYADGTRVEVIGFHVITHKTKDLVCRVFGARLRTGLLVDGLERCHACRNCDSIEGNEIGSGDGWNYG